MTFIIGTLLESFPTQRGPPEPAQSPHGLSLGDQLLHFSSR